MKIEHSRNKDTLFESQYKDSVRDSIKQHQALTKQVIDHLRMRGFYVTITYDSSGRTRILSSNIPITKGRNEDPIVFMVHGKFIAIEFGVNHKRKHPKQLRYKHQVKRDGGVYSLVRDFPTFLLWFNLKFGE